MPLGDVQSRHVTRITAPPSRQNPASARPHRSTFESCVSGSASANCPSPDTGSTAVTVPTVRSRVTPTTPGASPAIIHGRSTSNSSRPSSARGSGAGRTPSTMSGTGRHHRWRRSSRRQSPDGKAREQFVDRSATETSERHQPADEQRGNRKRQRGMREHGEPPSDHTDSESDQQRGWHVAEQAGTAERCEPVAARCIG